MPQNVTSQPSATPQDKVAFFHVQTAHEATLAVRVTDGLLSNTRIPQAEGYLPVVAMHIPTLPDMLFLTTDTVDKPQIWLEHYTARGVVLSIQAHSGRHSPNAVAFEDPARPGKFFTCRPLPEGQDANPVVGDCHHVMSWEEFTLLPREGSARLCQEAHDIAALFRRSISADDLCTYIRQYKGNNLLPALDSLLPIIQWDELYRLGARLMNDAELLKRLRACAPGTIWLEKTLPDLIAWEKQRQAATHTPFPPRRLEHSPAEESMMAWSGSDGAFAGMAHALNHAARRTIQPGRRACILTTVRNEGLYLLEWIAYHRALGVEHIFIYSNDNTDRSEILLEALAQEGIITYIRNTTDLSCSPQFKAYGHALNALPDILDFAWCFVIDGDEFITLNPARYHTVTDYLDWIDHWKTDGIAINWRFIASHKNGNGLEDLATPLTLRNNRIVGNGAIGDGWRLIKSAFRPHRVLHSRPHHPVWNNADSFIFRLSDAELHEYRSPPPGFGRDPAFADSGRFGRICISHFYFKSMTEWVWKHARNSGADAFQEIDTRRYNDQWANAFGMQRHDPQHEQNSWVLARQAVMMRELTRLRAIPTVREAENTVRTTLNEQLHALFARIQKENIFTRIDEKWQFILEDLEDELQGNLPLTGIISSPNQH